MAATFAVLTSFDGITFVRISTGEWLKAWPGMSISQDQAGESEVVDPHGKRHEHAADPQIAAKLEAELNRQRDARAMGVE